jgi:hypothetical protein
MKMKIWHFVMLVLAIIGLFAVIHYFTHHKGQSPVNAYLPGK